MSKMCGNNVFIPRYLCVQSACIGENDRKKDPSTAIDLLRWQTRFILNIVQHVGGNTTTCEIQVERIQFVFRHDRLCPGTPKLSRYIDCLDLFH